ncbi:MAG: ABC transporter permease, partial [Akkermansia sp.]|nr:ABC transporter permease [Akkermansia sp.]
ITPPPAEPRTEEAEEVPQPSFFTQFSTLLRRRFTILFRDRTQLWLQVAMIVIFPILVALFSSKGQDQLLQLTDSMGNDLAAEVQAQQAQAEVRARVGSAVSGIIMFQVILLGLMGSNNASREVAGERLIMEKEKFAGTGVGAYLASKLVYLSVLVLVQSLWMFAFVQYCWPLRGDVVNHFIFLLLANAAMTSVCLGISANCKTPDQSSLLSIYLVGFQLPLSGAVLALPEYVEKLTQPFISAYWAWSGSVNGGLDSEVLKAVNSIVQTTFSDKPLCMVVLLGHVLFGIVLTYIGVRRTRWE